MWSRREGTLVVVHVAFCRRDRCRWVDGINSRVRESRHQSWFGVRLGALIEARIRGNRVLHVRVFGSLASVSSKGLVVQFSVSHLASELSCQACFGILSLRELDVVLRNAQYHHEVRSRNSCYRLTDDPPPASRASLTPTTPATPSAAPAAA